jgi:hypothetical protein
MKKLLKNTCNTKQNFIKKTNFSDKNLAQKIKNYNLPVPGSRGKDTLKVNVLQALTHS